MPGPRFILASASPRRQSLLRDAGYEFEAIEPGIDESSHPPGLLPSQVAVYLAEAKCRAVSNTHPDAVVLAADTVVTFGDQMLGKPNDEAHARRMLQLLSGTTHIVITGVCIAHQAARLFKSTRVMSAVKMRIMTPPEIDRYLAGGEWKGKAGGYGIQDQDPFVTRQAGSKTNIIGLPMSVAKQYLTEAGVTPNR